MSRQYTYTDIALAEAIAQARSWRGTLRGLGLSATSAGASRSVRRRADALGFDYSHFTGQRRWTDRQLAEAVAGADSWAEVMAALGLAEGSSPSTVKGHAARLRLDTSHFRAQAERGTGPSTSLPPDMSNLRRAGSLLAAAWFTLRGAEVSWPLEPCRYDLLVWRDGRAERVQVKTTTVRSGSAWQVRLSSTTTGHAYDPDDIDYFFVVDGDLGFYLIPVATVGGLHYISLSAYSDYKVA